MTDNNDALCVAQQMCCCWQSPGTHRKAWGGNWAFLGGKPAWCFLTWEAQSTPSLRGSPLAPGTRSPCASWRTQLLSGGPLWSLCTTENEAQNFCVIFLREFIERAQCGYIYLEAVKHGNVDLHQSLVFPEGGSLSGVQAHLVCNLLGSKHENVEYNIICVIYLSSKPKFIFNRALDKSLYVLGWMLPPVCYSGTCHRSPSRRSPCPCTSRWRDRRWTPSRRSPASCLRQLGGRTISEPGL